MISVYRMDRHRNRAANTGFGGLHGKSAVTESTMTTWLYKTRRSRVTNPRRFQMPPTLCNCNVHFDSTARRPLYSFPNITDLRPMRAIFNPPLSGCGNFGG